MVAKSLFSWYVWSSRLSDKNPRECSNHPEGQMVNDSVEQHHLHTEVRTQCQWRLSSVLGAARD